MAFGPPAAPGTAVGPGDHSAAPGENPWGDDALTLPAIGRVPAPLDDEAHTEVVSWHPDQMLGGPGLDPSGEVPITALSEPVGDLEDGAPSASPDDEDSEPAPVGKFGPGTAGRRAAIAAGVAIPLVALAVVLVTHFRSSSDEDTTPASDSTTTSTSEPATPDPAPSDANMPPVSPAPGMPDAYPSDDAIPPPDPRDAAPPPPPPPLPSGPVGADQLPGGPPMAVPPGQGFPPPPPGGDPAFAQPGQYPPGQYPPGQFPQGQAQPNGGQGRVRSEPRDDGSAGRMPKKAPALGRDLNSITKPNHRSNDDSDDSDDSDGDSGHDKPVGGGLRHLGGGL
jgi:hypothetical protein